MLVNGLQLPASFVQFVQAIHDNPFPRPPWWAVWWVGWGAIKNAPAVIVVGLIVLFIWNVSNVSRDRYSRPQSSVKPQLSSTQDRDSGPQPSVKPQLSITQVNLEEPTVERRLCDLGYLSCTLPVSPAAVRKAVMCFQRVHRLKIDGDPGPQTQQMLFSAKAQAAPQCDQY